jgi:hypothetical protein
MKLWPVFGERPSASIVSIVEAAVSNPGGPPSDDPGADQLPDRRETIHYRGQGKRRLKLHCAVAGRRSHIGDRRGADRGHRIDETRGLGQRAHLVETAVDDVGRDVRDPVHVAEDVVGWQEKVVGEVVRFDLRERKRELGVTELAGIVVLRDQVRYRAFPERPASAARNWRARSASLCGAMSKMAL